MILGPSGLLHHLVLQFLLFCLLGVGELVYDSMAQVSELNDLDSIVFLEAFPAGLVGPHHPDVK